MGNLFVMSQTYQRRAQEIERKNGNTDILLAE
jgi:hypothetical protein